MRNLRKITVFFLALLLVGCGVTGVNRTGHQSETNKINMMQLKVGMTDDNVFNIMGRPYKVEKETVDGKSYDIWYYITRGKQLGQGKILRWNLSPLIFQDHILQGWGNEYYNYLLDIDNAREQKKLRDTQKYTNDPDEWPPNEHGYVPSPHEKQQKQESKRKKPCRPKKKDSKENPFLRK